MSNVEDNLSFSASHPASSSSAATNDDNLNYAIDLLPQSLYSGGGISAMSSRRPSYAAEFSSRPKLLNLPNPLDGSNTTPNINTSATSLGPLAPPPVVDELWPRSGDFNIWNKGSTAHTSPPTTKSLLTPPAAPGVAPATSGGDFALETALGSQRNFRSVSFSHARTQLNPPFISTTAAATTAAGASVAALAVSAAGPGPAVPPSTAAATLSPFYESSIDETSNMLNQTHLDEPRHKSLNPTNSLWFTPEGSASRRHSFATVGMSQILAPAQQQQQQQQQQQTRHASVIGTSPIMPHGVGKKTSPPMAAIIPEEPPMFDDDINKYFDSDPYARNAGVLNGDQSAAPAVPSLASHASLISVPSSRLYLVQFKATRVDVFYISESSSLNVDINDLVIVDADRGRDLGKVIKINLTLEEAGNIKWKQHQEQQAALQQTPGDSSAASNPSVMTPKQILRFAQPAEIQQIPNKQLDEEKAIKTCTAKVQEKNLSMVVVDAEYQWDRRKLTFFYSASYRIDFRDLVRDLFRIYKTRIWMCAVHNGGQIKAPAAPAAQQQHPQHPQNHPPHHHQAQPIMDLYRYQSYSHHQPPQQQQPLLPPHVSQLHLGPQQYGGGNNQWQYANNRIIGPSGQAPLMGNNGIGGTYWQYNPYSGAGQPPQQQQAQQPPNIPGGAGNGASTASQYY
ncbi:hypothetical protein D0Z00_000203 [Geotrichum galactomycetum]|uniref:Uncharacterized protein n=1 Tax=Geotrichum galactomycetum TaxID=27317 RepID=A0ACB6VAB8_9ASCO|nr:hypothetical protein D0Z00_000203 [Geotrichum candidum]